ncbi:MAG: hypothetical protein M0Q42_05040 [Xanthomonadales bacterium]|nr:hypothetical protein [Xanthomonadales bacterium]
MQILPLPSASTQPACQLRCQALPVSLTVTGLAAADLAALLQASASPSADWPQQRPPPVIVIDNPDVAPLPTLSAQVQSLQVGPDRVELVSGRAAHLYPGVAEQQSSLPSHFPQSLYLCLAQQWARSGVFALHAAGIVTADEGLLVLGERMAGKSTLALSALAAGHQVVSDDWLLLAADSDGRCQMERLREYLAIRPGPVAQRLLPRAALAGVKRTSSAEQRQLVPIDELASARFPVSAAVTRLWQLQPASDRPESTRIVPETAAGALASLITAAMPLLLSAQFPAERQALMTTAGSLLREIPAERVTAGRDLAREPGPNWERLLKTLAF